MEIGIDNEESVSSMSDFEDVVEVYEDALSPCVTTDEKPRYVGKYESEIDGFPNICLNDDSDNGDQEANCANDELEEAETVELKKYPLLEKSYPLRHVKWSPKIKSVCHISDNDSKREVKNEIHHLVLVEEDEIKQENELLNENEECATYRNDFQKSIFTEYPNLKIKDEFNFTSCSIKLEKIDLSHLSSVSASEFSDSATQVVSKKRRLSRARGRSRRRLRKNAPQQKSTAVPKSKRPIRSNESVKRRSSSRLKKNTSDITDEKTRSSQKAILKSAGEYEIRKRASQHTSARSHGTSATFSDESDTDLSLRTKSKKVRFMEAHGLTDRQESIAKSKNSTCVNSVAKTKRVSFANVNGFESISNEKEKDPVEEYRRAIARYSLEVDNYKRELNSWFECLCCDHKFATLEHCQVHVREHFPGMLTN